MSYIHSTYVVDDDPIYQFGMKILLRKVQFSDQARFFNNGQEAMDALHDLVAKGEELPSIIFLDLNMPIKDGCGFLEDFVKIPQDNRKRVTIYVVSSSINPTDEEKAKSFGVVNNYIIKPIEERHLKNVIAELGFSEDQNL